jgi:hypothetical protein
MEVEVQVCWQLVVPQLFLVQLQLFPFSVVLLERVVLVALVALFEQQDWDWTQLEDLL